MWFVGIVTKTLIDWGFGKSGGGFNLYAIAAQMAHYEKLLVCAPAFDEGINRRHKNITVEKIPQTLWDKYDYGVKGYDLKMTQPEIDKETDDE